MALVDEALEAARRTGEFRLAGQVIGKLPQELKNLSNLHTIRVTACGLSALPRWLADFDLVDVDLGRNGFAAFPDVLLEMRNLRRLGLSGVRFAHLPTNIDRLARLEVLVLSSCNLSSVPVTVRNLGRLAMLDLGYNNLENAADLRLPPNVEHLIISGNPLPALPDSVRALGRLQVLECSSAGIESRGFNDIVDEYRPEFPGFNRTIGVGPGGGAVPRPQGKLKSLPPWLPEMSALKWLDFTGQQVEALPGSMDRLRNLRGLLLAGNSLRSLPEGLGGLDRLRVLSLELNSIKVLPGDLSQLFGLSYLGLQDNELPIPPEVLAQPTAPDRIWEYLARTSEEQKPLDEAKVLVVGEGSVGKSSLIRRLTHGDFDPDERKTEGIDVTRWNLFAGGADIAVNLWDFGGQEIMHATHQFFLTRRSVYLLVVDARQSEEQNRIEYWLKLIQGISAGSPVIVVGNKCEKFGLDIDQRGLRSKYPDIVDIVETSCASNRGLDDVRESLKRTVGGLPHVRDLLPASFFAVKEYLEELDADYLPFADYEQLCLDRGVRTTASQELLVGFLHDLGTVLCFRTDPRLRDTNILNPSWVTGGVYRLLNSHVAAQAKGLLTWQDIDLILDARQYPPDKRQFIVEMMKKFELCYESDDVFLVPDLLTKEEPDTGSWDGSLHFVVRYGVLPSSIIGRLVIRLHRLISRGTVWRTGVVLAMDNNRALVKTDREDAVLTIKVSGPARGRRGLLTAIRAELRAIERTIPGLAGEEQVPVPGHPNVWVPYRHLLNLESAGKDTVVPQGLVDEFPIGQLLDGVETRSDRVLTGTVAGGSASSDETEAPDPVGEADGKAWSQRHTFLLGTFLIGAMLVVLTAYVVANKAIGGTAGAGAAVLALIVVVVVALVMLRTAGRVGEQTLLEGIKQALSQTGAPSKDGDA